MKMSVGFGVVTFARFYAVHVSVLPPLMMILIGIHIYLVRKHGVAAAPDDTAPPKRFFPEQVFKDTVGVFCAFIVLFVLAPGLIPWWPGLVGPLFWLIAFMFTTVARFSADPRIAAGAPA